MVQRLVTEEEEDETSNTRANSVDTTKTTRIIVSALRPANDDEMLRKA